jgi:hypothetical protein
MCAFGTDSFLVLNIIDSGCEVEIPASLEWVLCLLFTITASD